MTLGPRRWTVLASAVFLVLVGLALVVPSLTDRDGGDALRDEVVHAEVTLGVAASGGPPIVVAYGASELSVTRPVELINVRLAGTHDIPTVARIVRTGGTRAAQPSPSYPGLVCSTRWPPDGFGPTHPARSARFQAGERLMAVLYARVPQVAKVYKDVVVTYRADGRTRSQTVSGVYLRIEPKEGVPADVCAGGDDSFFRPDG